MTELNNALFRIDPTEGLLLYVQDIKPYHSKVLDVFVEYVYSESMTVAMNDRSRLTIGLPVVNVDDPLRSPQNPFVYSRGYGYAWSPYSSAMLGGLPQATIISAQGPIAILGSASGADITLTPDDSGYTFTVGQEVTLMTTGTFPPVSSGAPIYQGGNYFVVYAVGAVIRISHTFGGSPIIFSGVGTGQLSVVPVSLPVNSFVVTIPTPTNYDVVVASIVRNQIAFGTPFDIFGVNTTLRQWVVTGNVTALTPPLGIGDTVYVNSNADANANGEFTVTNVTYDVGTGRSTVTVQESISITATATGRLYVPLDSNLVPFWPAGSAVRFSTTGTMPFPLQSSSLYYIVPTSTPGLFNVSETRYPSSYIQITDLMSLGTGNLTVRKVEPFVPGEFVQVSGSHFGTNDGQYITARVEPDGPTNFRVFVRQHVPLTTPTGSLTDGVMSYIGDFGDPIGELISGPRLLTATSFHERIRFDFGPPPLAAYLFDSFEGSGDLSTHTADSGHTWSVFQLIDDLKELVLSGSGAVVTSDTDIWARANWTPPTSPTTFYVEAEVFVKAHPGSGSPYFRMFAKETNLTNFYGPFVDISPNLTTGKIQVSLRTGDSVLNSLYQADTSVNVDNTIVVRMTMNNQNQVQLRVNGTLVHTTATVAWPALTYAGFNFRTPAGDPTQFELKRFEAK